MGRSVKPPGIGLAEGFVAREITTSAGETRRYAVFLPPKYDPQKPWPLVVFLNGSGESGTDGVAQTRVGLGPFLVRHRATVPFVALFPQARTWVRGLEARATLEILDATMLEFTLDADRVYLTGLSLGGFGAWELAMQRPDLFAAIVPICGGGPPEAARNLVHLPVWAFHGARDDRVPVALSRKVIDELKRLGAKPKYTEFPTLGHECWDAAYATRGLFPWLLKQRRPPPPAAIAILLDPAANPVPTRVHWLRLDAVRPGAKRVIIRAAFTGPQEIRLVTRGVAGCTLLFDAPTYQPLTGPDVRVIWNDRVAFDGPRQSEIPLAAPRGRSPAAEAEREPTPGAPAAPATAP